MATQRTCDDVEQPFGAHTFLFFTSNLNPSHYSRQRIWLLCDRGEEWFSISSWLIGGIINSCQMYFHTSPRCWRHAHNSYNTTRHPLFPLPVLFSPHSPLFSPSLHPAKHPPIAPLWLPCVRAFHMEQREFKWLLSPRPAIMEAIKHQGDLTHITEYFMGTCQRCLAGLHAKRW